MSFGRQFFWAPPIDKIRLREEDDDDNDDNNNNDDESDDDVYDEE